MELETKIENPTVQKRLNDLDSKDKQTVREAVNYLARQDKNKRLKCALREIIKNFCFYNSPVPIWAIVILGIMRDREAVPYLLDVFESNEDYTEEAALDALIQIENAYPDSAIPEVFEFIAQRKDHDPNLAKIYAFAVLEPFVKRESVRDFALMSFEQDDDASNYIGEMLTDMKDKRVLEFFKRKLAFANQAGFDDNETKWHYYYLANGISYAEKYPDQDWKKSWENRWDRLLGSLGKEDENKDEEFDEEKVKKELEKIKRDIKEKGRDREFEKELAARDAQPIDPFCLENWLAIRQRSEIESEFQRTLDLIGAGGIWQAEDIQKIMNESRSSGPIVKMISERVNIPDEKSLTAIIESANRLWNNTPREELRGLTPTEMMLAYQQKQ